jgi:hypothetical protein
MSIFVVGNEMNIKKGVIYFNHSFYYIDMGFTELISVFSQQTPFVALLQS